MTEADIARVPMGNLRVPRAVFAAVWTAAEDREWAAAAGVKPWFRAGVAAACRWLAGDQMLVRPSAGAAAAGRTDSGSVPT